MNRIKNLFILLSGLLLWTGCSDDKEVGGADIRPITLTPEQDAVTITRENAAQTALTLTWNDESRYAGKTAYTLELTLKDAPVAKVHKVGEIAANSHSFTGAELQELIVGEWGAEAGDPVILTARVAAVTGSESVNLSAVVQVGVTTYATLLPLTLSADPQTLILDEAQAAETAVAFAWSDANDYAADAIYRFSLGISGDETAVETADAAGMGKTYTVGALNELLTETWRQEPGRRITLEARVAAYVGGEQQAVSAISYVDVTPYGATPVFASLALFGDATPGGTDPVQAVAMTRSGNDSPEFTWKGALEAGNLRVLCNPDGTLGVDQFIASEADREIVSGRSETMTLTRASDPARNAYMWKIAQAGEYTVTVDTEQRTILFTLERRFYTSLAMVGPATPGDWAITEATPLTRSGRVFTWEGDLKVGTLRFACDPDGTWETDQYIASERDKPVVPGVSEELVLAAVSEPNRGDFMWKIGVPGTWAVSVDTGAGTVVFTLKRSLLENCTAMHMVGDAAPNGWDAGNMTPLASEGTTWKWSGHLNRGELKFVCNRTAGNDWGEYQLLATVVNDPVTPDAAVKPFACTPAADNKWDIRTPGNYEIAVDMQAQTVTFRLVRSDAEEIAYPSLGLIGGAAPQGWGFDYSQSTLLPEDGNRYYTWTGHLNEGSLNIMCDISDTAWGSPRLTALEPDTQVVPGEACGMHYKQDDNAWLIATPGRYTIRVDIHAMQVIFTLEQADE
ncbi:protein of unknown function [Alistipes timonensis JC136]|uniref:SusE outer membrane protein domain-containing protein n=1 Tax=Alistipes timonensis JC136 TaxID=1033731 RepID=A0A1H3XCQ8_9BACT|nr:SusF/SusE family outer membrane protein [Alistipes timonensis]SDZ96318.1 protein of unknown function [Alistipes timonensis JC136]